VYFSEEVDLRRALDASARHFGFQFVRRHKGAGRFQALPFEQKSKAVDIASAAINPATALAVFVPPFEVGIERRFPSQKIGNFVVDEDMDHDFRPFLSFLSP
jgi:hypothetical protein